MAGLAAGRRLRAAGVEAVIFEKSRGPGGRCATRRQDGFVWDTGATSLLPRGKILGQVIQNELPTDDLVEITKPVSLHDNFRISAGDPGRGGQRWAYGSGMSKLAHLLADGLDIRTKSNVDRLERTSTGYEILEEAFDRLIITVPTPQASLLLWSIDERRPVANVRYRPCLSVCLGYDIPLPETPYFALLDATQRHPMVWLSLESVKCPSRAPGVVVQFNREYSGRWFTRLEEEMVATAAQYLEALYGSAYAKPVASDLMRWKYAQPEALAPFEEVNPAGSTLILAGDALYGGHLDDAYECGWRAAGALIA